MPVLYTQGQKKQVRVTLTEGQMSTILYILEGYIDPTNDNSYDPEFREDVDNILIELEGVVDNNERESKFIDINNTGGKY